MIENDFLKAVIKIDMHSEESESLGNFNRLVGSMAKKINEFCMQNQEIYERIDQKVFD